MVVTEVGFDSQSVALFGPESNGIRVWDVASGRALATVLDHEDVVEDAVFSLDGTQVASGSKDQTLRIWDAETGQVVGLVRADDEVRSVAFSPDGSHVAAGLADGGVDIWNASTLANVLMLAGNEAAVHTLAFSPDGTRIASGSEDATVRIWDPVTGELIAQIGVDANALTFSPDGTRFVAAGRDVRVWDAVTFDPLLTLGLEGAFESTRPPAQARSISFSVNGTALRAVSTCGNLVQWGTGSAYDPDDLLPDGR